MWSRRDKLMRLSLCVSVSPTVATSESPDRFKKKKAYATRGHLNAALFRFLQVTWQNRELERRKRRCNRLVHSPEVKQDNMAQKNTHLLLR